MYFYVIAMKLSWYKFATKEYIITLSDIYQTWLGEGVLGQHAKGKSWGVDRKTSIYVHNYKPSSMQWCQCHKCFTTYCTHCLIAFPFSQTPHLKACQENKRERFYRAMLCTARTTLSKDVCPSVRPVHTVMLSKRINISSNFSHHRVYPDHSSLFTSKLIAIFQREFP